MWITYQLWLHCSVRVTPSNSSFRKCLPQPSIGVCCCIGGRVFPNMPPKGKARATTAAHSRTVDAIREQKKMAQATLKQLRGAIKQELTKNTYTHADYFGWELVLSQSLSIARCSFRRTVGTAAS